MVDGSALSLRHFFHNSYIIRNWILLSFIAHNFVSAVYEYDEWIFTFCFFVPLSVSLTLSYSPPLPFIPKIVEYFASDTDWRHQRNSFHFWIYFRDSKRKLFQPHNVRFHSHSHMHTVQRKQKHVTLWWYADLIANITNFEQNF